MPTPTKPNSRLGTYVLKTFKDESFRAYVPPPLPPDPPLALQRLLPLLEQANQALGRLDGLASILPDPSLFIYLYVRKEAVLSSQIEGTQSSFSDLMLFESAETPSVPLKMFRTFQIMWQRSIMVFADCEKISRCLSV
jgi:hypothetical protein